MTFGFSCYQLDPFVVADALGAQASLLELTVPEGGVEAATRVRRELLDPRGIEAVLSVLLLPDGIALDGGSQLVPWAEAAPFLDILRPRTLRLVGVKGQGYDSAYVDRIAGQIAEIVPHAEARGAGLAYENHGEPLTTMQGILHAVDSPMLRILLDPANGHTSGDGPLAVTEALLPLAEYVHVKDLAVADDGRGTLCAVGDGDMPWPDLCRMFRMARRPEIFAFELPAYAGNAVDGYRQGMAAFRRLMERETAAIPGAGTKT